MRRIVVAAAMLLPAMCLGQGRLPDIGELAYRSKDLRFIQSGCPIAYNLPGKIFQCAPTEASISISRQAEALNRFTSSPPTLSCSEPCYIAFPDSGSILIASMDWIMPSRGVDLADFRVSWVSDGSTTGSVVWRMDWCQYVEGQPSCLPSGANAFLIESPASAAPGGRVDAAFTGATSFPVPDWLPNAHVIVEIARVHTDAADTMAGEARLQNVRMEFSPQW